MAGCGLKHSAHKWSIAPAGRITRPVGRVRIETQFQTPQPPMRPCITRPVGRVRIETRCGLSTALIFLASPGRLAGCGLKPNDVASVRPELAASPGRLAGCGLKLFVRTRSRYRSVASPGRLAGCGLKHTATLARVYGIASHHPAGWPGAD